MCKYFVAGDDLAIETEHVPFHIPPGGGGRQRGRMRAHVTVHEPGDEAHPSLPTLRDLLEGQTDPRTGLLSYDFLGRTLSIDPTPLRDLPPEYLDYRVSPGSSFVPNELLEKARAETSDRA